ncbi:MAG: RHS repeat domain-containing protein [Acidobacteriota bacterium]
MRNRFAFIILMLGLTALAFGAGSITYTYDEDGELIGVDYGDGTEIHYSYDAGGNLLSREVIVEETRLYFPFYQASASTFLGIAVSNYSDAAVPLDFTAYNRSGQLAGYGQNPSSERLAAGQQSARLASEIFQTGAEAQDAWVELSSNSTRLSSFFQFGNGSLTELDGSIALSRHNREFFFSRVYQGDDALRDQRAQTYLSLANPTSEPVTVVLKLFTTESSEGGASVRSAATTERTIPAKGFVYENISQLFGASVVTEGYVRARVSSGFGLAAFELIELPDRTTIIGLNASDGNLAPELYSAQLADGSGIYTSLKLINISDQPRRFQATAVGDDGEELARTEMISLGVGEYLERDVGLLFGFPTASDLTVGSLKIETDGPGIIGDVVFGDPIGFKYAASLPLQTKKLTRAIFSQVASTENFFTGLAFYNPDTEQADVRVRVYNSEGGLEGDETKTLPAGNRISGLVPELVPSAAGVVGGYIVVEATRPLIAQQIFGEAALNQFSAVPPKIDR